MPARDEIRRRDATSGGAFAFLTARAPLVAVIEAPALRVAGSLPCLCEREPMVPPVEEIIAVMRAAGKDAVDAQLESEHGILEIMSRAETVRAGIGSAIAYLLRAAIPLIVTVAVPAAVESSLILAAVFVSLIVTSGIGARTGHMNLPRTLARALIVGLGTMPASYLAGTLIF